MLDKKGVGFGKRRLIHEIVKDAWQVEDPYEMKFTLNDVLYIVQEMNTDEGKKYLEKTGPSTRGYATFRYFVQHLLYRNLANYDSMVLLTSEKGCLTSDTKIMIPRDTKKYPEGVPIKELINKGPIYVYSFNSKTKKVELKLSDGVEFVKRDKVYEIELTTGQKIRATEDHPFMLMNGEYSQLKDLYKGQNLRFVDEKTPTTATIKSIKYIGKRNVYDVVNVRDNHNFIANKMVVSNTGKSNTAIMMAREWCRLLGIRFNPDRHLAYNNRDVMEKIDLLNPWEPLVCDEAVRFASTSDWSKKESIELRKKIAEVRTKHLFFILCFPLKISKVEKTYLEAFVNYWCLTGDTKIVTRDITGMIRNTKIKDINKRNPEVLTFNLEKQIYEFKHYEKKIKTKRNSEIYELQLQNDLKIKCTEDHPFLTQRGWVRLKDLKHDDVIKIFTKKCIYCGEQFVPKKQQQKHCSIECNNKRKARSVRARNYRKNYLKNNMETNKIMCKKNYETNRARYLKLAKKYRESHKEEINKYASEYRKKNRILLRKKYKEHIQKKGEEYRKKRRELYAKYMRENINFRIRTNLRNALRRVLNNNNVKKTHSIFKYLGCTIDEFKEHISNQFQKGMTWDNWGKDTWHIDHIIPCSHFDLRKEKNRHACFNYKNQQPMWATDNLKKGDRYVC